MKNLYIIGFVIAISCIGCSRTFYQVFNTVSLDLDYEEGYYSYQNEDLIIGYDLWADGGNGSFIVANRTDNEIFIDLERSHMVVNGLAISYFNNLMLTSSNHSQLTVSRATAQAFSNTYIFGSNVNSNVNAYSSVNTVSTVTENSITQVEKRIVSIPPSSYVIVSGYHINNSEFTDCDLVRFPSKKKVRTLKFERVDSPIAVRNFLVYSGSESFDDFKTIDNEFWVSEVTNYPYEEFFAYNKVSVCDKEKTVKVHQFSSPSAFYVTIKEVY